MGNRSTSAECLKQLGIIDTPRQIKFKRDVLDFLQERRKCEFAVLESHEIPTLVGDYVRSTNFVKWKPDNQQISQQGETRHTKLLEHLVQIWIEDKRRQESQDDPSYTGDKSKKRKRQGEQADNQRAISSFFSLNHQNGSSSIPSASASVSSDDTSLEDIEHHAPDGDSLPDASILIADRSSRENTYRPQQPQTPTPASASPEVRSAGTPKSGTRRTGASALGTQTTTAQTVSSVRTPESIRKRIPPQLGSPQRFRDETEQPLGIDHRRRSTIEFEETGGESATVRASSDVLDPRYTPPPTIKRPAFIKTKDHYFVSDHLEMFKQPREDSDAWELLNEIVEYVDACEKRSLCIAQSHDSFPGQVQEQRIRAQVFTNLKRDIESRIHAKVDDDGVRGKTPITSYCLWSGPPSAS